MAEDDNLAIEHGHTFQLYTSPSASGRTHFKFNHCLSDFPTK